MAELEELKARRPQIIEAISSAREQGDLSENSEYQTAKEEQASLEHRIEEIEKILKNHTLISKKGKRSNLSAVALGSTVRLKTADGEERVIEIVGTIEADPFINKISDDSPVGKSLLGKLVGDEVSLPGSPQPMVCKIIAID